MGCQECSTRRLPSTYICTHKLFLPINVGYIPHILNINRAPKLQEITRGCKLIKYQVSSLPTEQVRSCNVLLCMSVQACMRINTMKLPYGVKVYVFLESQFSACKQMPNIEGFHVITCAKAAVGNLCIEC